MPTEQQRAIIEAPLEPSIVIAGAGSGKTETMANRVVWLLANRMIDASHVLGLTFTRKASGELTTRIRRRCHDLVSAGLTDVVLDAFDAPTVATYNSFAHTIFRENAAAVGREPDALVLSDPAAWHMARRLVVTSSDTRLVDLDKSVDHITAAVIGLSRALSENVARGDRVRALSHEFALIADLPTGSPRVAGLFADLRDPLASATALGPLVDLAEQFSAEKAARSLVEYSDQVALALAVCERVPSVAADHRDRFRAVILDEYQDTSVVQTRLLATLFAGHGVMAVGDPHQSIYGWRGASSANLARFSRDFGRADEGARVFALSTSWRNSRHVLAVANRIVEPLRAASPVPVESLEPRPHASSGAVEVSYHETIIDEARAVADWFVSVLASGKEGDSLPTAAVLCRSIKSIAPFTAALARRDVPFRVLGMGGLLDEPVVVDVVCALRVLHDATAGSELVRLLTGARWRIGTKDIVSLRALASWLSERDDRLQPLAAHVRERQRGSVADDDAPSIIDALDFLADSRPDSGALSGFSPVGLDRLRDAARVFATLRSRTGSDLIELVTTVVHELRLDCEAAANESAPGAQASLDAFEDHIREFRATDTAATLGSFLSWIRQAERNDSLAPRCEEPEPGTVQILTVHGAKGLEWDHVALPRFVDGEFSGAARSKKGWLAFGALPDEFRGDSAELPPFDWRGATTQKEVVEAIRRYEDGIVERRASEDRRLAYVGMTRAKESLLVSGSFWASPRRARGPSVFIRELESAHLTGKEPIAREPVSTENPLGDGVESVEWPRDPLGDRAPRVRAAAAAVRSADPAATTEWSRDITLLVAERDARATQCGHGALPRRIPASRFKDYVSDPLAIATQRRRPVPERPVREATVGTRFHSWVEKRALGVSPPALVDATVVGREGDATRDRSSDDETLARLTLTFEASEWANRRPDEVELEIHMILGEHVIVCKLDAVYRSGERYQIVDWKTGKAPRDDTDLELRNLQLALYRRAFSQWKGIAPERVDAVFYFVADNAVVRPRRSYSERELVSMWSSVSAANPA